MEEWHHEAWFYSDSLEYTPFVKHYIYSILATSQRFIQWIKEGKEHQTCQDLNSLRDFISANSYGKHSEGLGYNRLGIGFLSDCPIVCSVALYHLLYLIADMIM